MKIVDCVLFNGEKEVLDLRLNILKDFVDYFIVCEATSTFSGKSKPLYYLEDLEKYQKFSIEYYMIGDDFTAEEIDLAENSPNTKGPAHFLHEFLQKERIKKALIGLDAEDIVFISDCDEIYDPKSLSIIPEGIYRINQIVYVYYLNNKSDEQWAGTLLCKYKDIKDGCLNHLRTAKHSIIGNGWHFTSLAKDLRRKLTDSYTAESYAADYVLNNLEKNIKANKDFLGRDFKYEIDESQWPEYLTNNRSKYAELFRNNPGI